MNPFSLPSLPFALPDPKDLWQQPLAFFGGFTSGLLQLQVTEEPLKSWLAQQGIASEPAADPGRPQTIEIE